MITAPIKGSMKPVKSAHKKDLLQQHKICHRKSLPALDNQTISGAIIFRFHKYPLLYTSLADQTPEKAPITEEGFTRCIFLTDFSVSLRRHFTSSYEGDEMKK